MIINKMYVAGKGKILEDIVTFSPKEIKNLPEFLQITKPITAYLILENFSLGDGYDINLRGSLIKRTFRWFEYDYGEDDQLEEAKLEYLNVLKKFRDGEYEIRTQIPNGRLYFEVKLIPKDPPANF